MIDKEKIRQLIERGCGDRMDSEQTLRDSVIGGGLLEAMGWSFDKGEWTPNVAISFGTTTHHMDYWVGNEESKWVLEAKNPINRIDRDKDVKELLSYMKQKDSQYGFLYNGKELLAFKLGSDLPFYEWSCDRNTEIFEMFSNDHFPIQLEQFIRSQGALARFQNYVKQNTSNIKDQIIDLVAENSHTPKEIVDQYFPFLISLFSNGIQSEDSLTQENLDTYGPGSNQEWIRNAIPEVPRKRLSELPNGTVIVCPAESKYGDEWGLNFLKKHGLWESVRIKNDRIQSIKYIAFYFTKPESKVLYFAEVSKIVDALDKEFRRIHGLLPAEPNTKGKKAIEFKNGSLVKLTDPIISVPGPGGGIRGPTYTDLNKFISAQTVRDFKNKEL